MHPKYNVPINAVYVTGAFSFLLSLIYIGSPTAFYAITSLFTVALLQCYMFSIGSILWRRIYLPDTIPKSHFSLGKWGLPINAVALIWCMWSFVSLVLLSLSLRTGLTLLRSSGLSGRYTHLPQLATSIGRRSFLLESSFAPLYIGSVSISCEGLFPRPFHADICVFLQHTATKPTRARSS